ncbi:bifunctional riboflavin kinase/FAD synthetase [Flexithrix dorotheae]|uniref:bifunctional riboflavin kinase/FAD synthetase n=1 Tax=Flexithrix dorotheae TaxID=70993 RepID=UPI000381D016|nr:bifunctional riboflavin kinase/FAD synthetase [Flexithrix dorotheae]
MKVYHGLDDFIKLPPSVVTSGTFDGVHIGHQKILERLKHIAEQENKDSVVITFWPHPRFVLNSNGHKLKLISTLEEKISYLKAIGIDHLLIIPFDKKFSQLSSQEFIQKIIIEKANTKKLVIGYDHRFGKNREGSFEFLKANAGSLGFEVEEIPKQEIEEIAVSSTKIRAALESGKVEIATKFLGKQYQLSGVVEKGDQIGRTLGFPTANIHVEEDYKLIPANGIFAVQVQVKAKNYNGMLNIGFRPTIAGNLTKRIEVNIFDFDQDIYGEKITLSFVKYLRSEIKFSGIEELKTQLKKDKEEALKYLN